MDNYPSNSNKKRKEDEKPTPETKKVERVISGDVVRRKKPLGKRFSETFVAGDVGSVWEFVLGDVLIPAAKDMIADAGREGLERLIFGDSSRSGRRSGRNSNSSTVGNFRYDRQFSDDRRSTRKDEGRGSISRRARSQHDFDEIILDSRAEAEAVLDNLYELVSRFDAATVADLYELVGISGSGYTDSSWGWTSLRGSEARRVRNGGYLLDLPRPIQLD